MTETRTSGKQSISIQSFEKFFVPSLCLSLVKLFPNLLIHRKSLRMLVCKATTRTTTSTKITSKKAPESFHIGLLLGKFRLNESQIEGIRTGDITMS